MEEGEGTNAAASAASTATSQSACFDCSICLDRAVDPVVTLCGHLHCRGCIHHWLRVKAAASCPVCKAHVSENALVPLLGRGGPRRSHHPKGVPSSPNVLRTIMPRREARYYDHCYANPQWSASVFSSTAGAVLGGLAVALRASASRTSSYSLRPYQLETSGSGRELRAAESLHEIWVFLFCCAVLCLLFF